MQPPSFSKQVLPTSEAKRYEWYDSFAVIGVAFLFCFPLGFVPLWLSRRISIQAKTITTGVLVVAVPVAVILGFLVLAATLAKNEPLTPNVTRDSVVSGNVGRRETVLSHQGKRLFTVTPEEFRLSFNREAARGDFTDVGIPRLKSEVSNELLENQSFAFSSGLTLLLTADKRSGNLVEAKVYSSATTQADAAKSFTVFCLMPVAISQTIEFSDVGEKIVRLIKSVPTTGSSPKVTLGDVQIQMMRTDEVGLTTMILSPAQGQ